jgi:hypothetical protein
VPPRSHEEKLVLNDAEFWIKYSPFMFSSGGAPALSATSTTTPNMAMPHRFPGFLVTFYWSVWSWRNLLIGPNRETHQFFCKHLTEQLIKRAAVSRHDSLRDHELTLVRMHVQYTCGHYLITLGSDATTGQDG